MTRLLTCLVALALVFTGCREDHRFNANPTEQQDPDADKIKAEFKGLERRPDDADPDNAVVFESAVRALTRRGSRIEPRVIDTLRSTPNPSIRLGCIEILSSIATVNAIEHLIAVTDDADAEVAFRAEMLLRQLCGVRLIPETGKPDRDGLPAVPARAANDLAMDAELRIWTAWHGEHKAKLKAAWETWWTASKQGFSLKDR